jgi:hypothetical protein
MSKLRVDLARGWIIPFIELVTDIWTRYCVIWAWSGIYWYISIDNKNSKKIITQNCVATDTLWISLLISSILFFSLLSFDLTLQISFFSIAIWRNIDHFFVAIRSALFGFYNNPNIPEIMHYHRAQRRIAIVILIIIELIYFWAIIYWFIQENFNVSFSGKMMNSSHALQLSFSSVSTIGYGTYAPNDRISVTLAIFQSITALLYIGGIISQMIGNLKQIPSNKDSNTIQITYKYSDESVFDDLEWKKRMYLPPIITIVGISSLYSITEVLLQGFEVRKLVFGVFINIFIYFLILLPSIINSYFSRIVKYR